MLRSIVASAINSDDCKSLVQYTGLKRDIVQTAGTALGEVAWACMDRNVAVLDQAKWACMQTAGAGLGALACLGAD